MKMIKIKQEIEHINYKIQGYTKVSGTDLLLPVTIICGEFPGKTILITGGIHNAEYVGIQAAIELAQYLQPGGMVGKIIILPLVNRTGFEHRTMSCVYEDGKNLNREFPGQSDGTLGERICWFLEKEVFVLSDYYVDLHCGDGYEELKPYVYCQGSAKEKVRRASREMAWRVQVPYIVESKNDSGGAYNYAGSIGLPGILIERGNLGVWSKEEVDADIKDVYNILQFLGIRKDKEIAPVNKAVVITETFYEASEENGCWYPKYHAGDIVEQGTVLGEIRDYFGNVIKSYAAKEKAVILYQTASLCVVKNGLVIAYGKLPDITLPVI